MRLNYYQILGESQVDGPNTRAVLFYQGCLVECPGCQNKHLWSHEIKRHDEIEEIADHLLSLGKNITLSGGDPMEQPRETAELVTVLREKGAEHIIIYTGYVWEHLIDPNGIWSQSMKTISENVDVLVDGPYERALDDSMIMWMGSRNQRAIDVPATLETGKVVELDWSKPEVILTKNGDLLVPEGIAQEFGEIGKVSNTRRCGQTN